MANSTGRAGWAFTSDFLGSKQTYNLFALGIPAAISVPLLAHNATEGGIQTLYLFSGATLLSVSFYGGLLSCLPPYIGRTFGPAHVGAIHGRILAGWSVAATLGPQLFACATHAPRSKITPSLHDVARRPPACCLYSTLQTAALSSRAPASACVYARVPRYTRGQAKSAAIDDLASKCSPATFEATFGAGIDQLEALKAANTATIPRLLEIAPPGTPDPTPYLYDVTYQYVTGLLCLAACANLMVRPAVRASVAKAAKDAGLK